MQMHLCESKRDFKGPIQVFELIINDSSLGICSAWQPCWSTVIVCSDLIDYVLLGVKYASWRLQVKRHLVMTSLPVLWQMTLSRLGRMLDLTEGEEETSLSLCRWSAYQAKDEFSISFESNFNYSKRGEETLIWWRFCLCSLKKRASLLQRQVINHPYMLKKKKSAALLAPASLALSQYFVSVVQMCKWLPANYIYY